jgi:hypothetical protein
MATSYGFNSVEGNKTNEGRLYIAKNMVIQNGLILNLDAGVSQSYPGTGTTWTDLSDNGKNGTLTNGPTFNSGNGGSIVFDGVNDNITPVGSTFNYSPGTTGSISLEVWVYPTGPYTSYLSEPPTTNLGGIIGQGYFGGSNGWGLGISVTSGINYFQIQIRNGNTISFALYPFTNNFWYHLVGRFSRNQTTDLYMNGNLVSSVSNSNIGNLTITPSTNNASIGRINQFHSGCSISQARIYNRALSTAEIIQNYKATKSRFGL